MKKVALAIPALSIGIIYLGAMATTRGILGLNFHNSMAISLLCLLSFAIGVVAVGLINFINRNNQKGQ